MHCRRNCRRGDNRQCGRQCVQVATRPITAGRLEPRPDSAVPPARLTADALSTLTPPPATITRTWRFAMRLKADGSLDGLNHWREPPPAKTGEQKLEELRKL